MRDDGIVSEPFEKANPAMTNFRQVARCGALMFAALAIDASAQPTQAQQNAIRQSCRGDFQLFCTGVQPGGQAALSCLQQNAAKATPACQQALGAMGSGGAPANASAAGSTGGMTSPQGGSMQQGGAMQGGTQQGGAMQGGGMQQGGTMQGGGVSRMSMREELMITRQACGQDFRTYCQGVQPGGGRAITCLESNGASLSPGCQKALMEMKQQSGR